MAKLGESFRNIFKIQELRTRILFTAALLIVVRIGAHITLPGVDAETLLIALDLEGICASAGSACHSGAARPSSVLSAIGLDDESARSTLRLSVGWTSTDEDVTRALDAIPRLARSVQEAIHAPREHAVLP